MLLDNLSETAPSLVQSVVPKLVPLHQLTGILRALLEERVPISDLRRILENLATLAGRNLSIIDTAEMLRVEQTCRGGNERALQIRQYLSTTKYPYAN